MGSPYYKHTSFGLASRLSCRARDKIFDAFMGHMRPREYDKVLDVGVTSDTSRPESNFFERKYPWRGNLTCVGTENASHLQMEYPGLQFIRVHPGSRLPFPDRYFDIAFSNATLEHAGSRLDQVLFLSELIRVGKSFFIATPNRWCPMEFHTSLPFLHWLPRRAHRAVLEWIGHNYWCREENLRLLGESDLRKMLAPWTGVSLSCVRMLGVTTNLIVYRR